MLIKKYRSEVVSIINPFEGIYTLELKSLSGRYKYYPGQFLHLSLDQSYDGSDQWPDSRCFSMQSNPGYDTIKITYAVKGKFTSFMEEQLAIGSEIWLKLPYGDLFTQPHNKSNSVFIAGGTGITPFLSLFTDTSFSEYLNPVLYAGFRNSKMNIYTTEIELAKKINPKFVFVPVYQDEKGLLDISNIYKANGQQSEYFISGPPLMIKHFKEYLLKNGIDIKKILTDSWE